MIVAKSLASSYPMPPEAPVMRAVLVSGRIDYVILHGRGTPAPPLEPYSEFPNLVYRNHLCTDAVKPAQYTRTRLPKVSGLVMSWAPPGRRRAGA